MRSRATVWEQGRVPGRLVVAGTVVTAALVVALDLTMTDRLSLFFDLCFVVLCLTAALSVRPGEFFAVGVTPPLLMIGTVLTLAAAARSTVADPGDPMVQAVVSGLAHHASALMVGHSLTLTVLALRQVALRQGLPGQRPRAGAPYR